MYRFLICDTSEDVLLRGAVSKTAIYSEFSNMAYCRDEDGEDDGKKDNKPIKKKIKLVPKLKFKPKQKELSPSVKKKQDNIALTIKEIVNEWEPVAFEDRSSDGSVKAKFGFAAIAYKNKTTNEIVIAYRGTDSMGDIVISDVQIALKDDPQQASKAVKFYERVKEMYPDSEISLTGHSLGGSLAHYVSAAKGVTAVTFNAPAVKLPKGGDTSKIVNYVNLNDYIGCYGDHKAETRYYLPDGMVEKGYKPHSDYRGQDYSNYKPLPEGVKWDYRKAFVMWKKSADNKGMVANIVKGMITPILEQKKTMALMHTPKMVNLTSPDYKYQNKEGVLVSFHDTKQDDYNVVPVSSVSKKNESDEEKTNEELTSSSQESKNTGEKEAKMETAKSTETRNKENKEKSDSETKPKHKYSSLTNEHGHWITTKQGNKVFIEDALIEDLKWYYPELEDIPKEDEEIEEINSNSKEVDENPPLSIMQKGLQMEETPENDYWYLPNVPLTKAGVFPYYGQQISPNLEPDKLYMVYRPAEEIGSDEALKTLELLPVIEDHAMLGTRPGMMPPEEKGIQGITGTNIYCENGVVYGDIKIFTEYLKNVINSGKHEISMGYFCDYDYSSGYYNGQRYDVIQRNLRGNHIAIVDKGRMGEDVCIPMMLHLGTYDGINSEILLYDETVVYSSEVQSSYRSLEEQWQAYLRGE